MGIKLATMEIEFGNNGINSQQCQRVFIKYLMFDNNTDL